jgi:predicted metal-binding membrane protein
MLVIFPVGIGNFGRMLVPGAIMATEKNLPWGRRISYPLGVLPVARRLALLLGVMAGSQGGLGE